MDVLRFGIVLMFAATVAGETGETVYLKNLNREAYRRSQSRDQDETLNFRLRHSAGETNLNFVENVNLNADAPLFVTSRQESGENAPVQLRLPHNKEMRFFQDKKNGAYVRSSCNHGDQESCFSTLEGSVFIEGREYKLEPVTDSADKRHADLGVPHRIEESKKSYKGSIRRTSSGQKIAVLSEDNSVRKKTSTSKAIREDEKLSSHARTTRLQRRDTQSQEETAARQSDLPSIVNHNVEVLVMMDHIIYESFAQLHDTLSVDGIYTKMKQYFALLINGADLMYGSIQEVDISISLSIAGFYLSTDESNSKWMNYKVPNTDADSGLDYLSDDFNEKFPGLPKNDHIALFTGSNIMSGGDPSTVGVSGLGGLCTAAGVSINQFSTFFQSSTTFAHELGHNAGADHDTGPEGTACSSSADFIMTPFVTSIEGASTNTNSWRFSPCSINSFRDYLASLGPDACTLTRANVNDEEEYKYHKNSLPGRLYSVKQQCELLGGKGAKLCNKNKNTPRICRQLGCEKKDGDFCSTYVAAHGTPCGNGLACFEGLCKESIKDELNKINNPSGEVYNTDDEWTGDKTEDAGENVVANREEERVNDLNVGDKVRSLEEKILKALRRELNEED